MKHSTLEVLKWFTENHHRIQYNIEFNNFMVRCKNDLCVIGIGGNMIEALDQAMTYFGEDK